MSSLEELLGSMLTECVCAWDDLPTFGGEPVSDTTGVWSWDATRLLVGDCADELQIVSREEWAR